MGAREGRQVSSKGPLQGSEASSRELLERTEENSFAPKANQLFFLQKGNKIKNELMARPGQKQDRALPRVQD